MTHVRVLSVTMTIVVKKKENFHQLFNRRVACAAVSQVFFFLGVLFCFVFAQSLAQPTKHIPLITSTVAGGREETAALGPLWGSVVFQ